MAIFEPCAIAYRTGGFFAQKPSPPTLRAAMPPDTVALAVPCQKYPRKKVLLKQLYRVQKAAIKLLEKNINTSLRGCFLRSTAMGFRHYVPETQA